MLDNNKVEQYLALAEEAEHHAATGVDRYARDQWLRIAQSYRDIAQGTEAGCVRASAADSVPEQNSDVPACQAPPQGPPDAASRQSVWHRIKAFLRRDAG